MEEWIASLEEVLPDLGIEASREQIQKLAKCCKDIGGSISDSSFEVYRATPPAIDHERLSKYHERRVRELQAENEILRGSAARRLGVPIEDVYVEGDEVRYDILRRYT